jgi:hypothetical protein
MALGHYGMGTFVNKDGNKKRRTGDQSTEQVRPVRQSWGELGEHSVGDEKAKEDGDSYGPPVELDGYASECGDLSRVHSLPPFGNCSFDIQHCSVIVAFPD